MAIVAHQGGWDEALYVLVPLVLLAGLLRLAKRRAEAEARQVSERAAAEARDDGAS